ncbi:unnamed protein product, partial [Sphacelaria rigidula]
TQEGQSLAGGIISSGEWGLQSLKSMPTDGAVGKVLEKLADPELEGKIMRGINNIDTDYLLDTAERAMTDAEARAQLLDGIKDSTVDFLLEYLPHIEVPPISGTSTRVGYAITNLDLSGFRLRKEDVKVELVDSMSRKSSKQPSPDGKDDGQKYQASAGSGGGGHDAVDSTINPYQKKNGKDGKAGDQRRTDTLAGLSPDEMAKLSLPIPPSGSPAMIGITPSHSITTAGGGSSFAALKGGALPVSSAVESKNREEKKPEEVLRVVARGIGAEFKTLQWACRQ